MDFDWLKKLMLCGFYGCVVLILFLLVVVVIIVVMVMFLQCYFEDVMWQMMVGMMCEIVLIVLCIDEVLDMQMVWIEVQCVVVLLDLELFLFVWQQLCDYWVFYDLLGCVVIEELYKSVVQVEGVDLSQWCEVCIMLNGWYGVYELVFLCEWVSVLNLYQLLVLMIGILLLMMVIVMVFLCNQLWLIKWLVCVVEGYGKGCIIFYCVGGVSEICSVGMVFLEMCVWIEWQNEQCKQMLLGVSYDLCMLLMWLWLGLLMLSLDLLFEFEEIVGLESDVVVMGKMIDVFLDYVCDVVQDVLFLVVLVLVFVQGIVVDVQCGGQVVKLCKMQGEMNGCVMFCVDSLCCVVENLIGNVVCYGNCVEVEVVLGFSYFCVLVEDDGLGILCEQCDEVLKFFIWLDVVCNQNWGQGVGLGFVIVVDIVCVYGG